MEPIEIDAIRLLAVALRDLIDEIRVMRSEHGQYQQVFREYTRKVMENDNERMVWAREDRERYNESIEEYKQRITSMSSDPNKKADA